MNPRGGIIVSNKTKVVDHKIYVSLDSRSKWKVRPDPLGKKKKGGERKDRVKVGDTITFIKAGTPVRIYISPTIFGGRGETRVINVKPKSNYRPLKVREAARDTTIFYAAFCLKKGEWAEGNSYPKIITDP